MKRGGFLVSSVVALTFASFIAGGCYEATDKDKDGGVHDAGTDGDMLEDVGDMGKPDTDAETGTGCPANTVCVTYLAGDKGCVPHFAFNTTKCDDKKICTKDDKCDGKGTCAGTAYTCKAGQCESNSACDGKGGCLATYKPVTATCDDGTNCTKDDKCDGKGKCAGTTYTCATAGQCESSVTCDGKGGCTKAFKPAGTACDDKKPATTSDQCDGKGGCAGTSKKCLAGMVFVNASTDFCIDSSDSTTNKKSVAVSACSSKGSGGRVCDVDEIDLAVKYNGLSITKELATTKSTGCCCPCGSYKGSAQHFWTVSGGIHGFKRGKCECWFENRPSVTTYYRCCSNPTATPVAWYRFEQNAGQVLDSSGNGNHGTAKGGITRGVSGKHGKAFTFGGSNGYVEVPHSSSFDFGLESLTIEFWMNGTAKKQGILDKTGGTNYGIHFQTDSKNMDISIYGGTASVNVGISSVPTGSWHHIAVVVDRSTKIATSYLDGVVKKAQSISAVGSLTKNVPLRIGHIRTTPSYFSGLLDEVKFYKYARTAAQIAGDVSAGTWKTTTPLPGPVTTHAVVSYGQYIYVIGGTTKTGSPPSANSKVYFAKVATDGSISSWSTTSSPGGNWHNLGAAVNDNVIFAAGGSNGYGALSKLMYAQINKSDGKLSSWKAGQSLPSAQENAALATHGGYLYAIGGRNTKCYYALIGSVGSLGSWKTCSSLPEKGGNQNGAVTFNNRIYYIGNGGTNPKLFWTDIGTGGALGTWKTVTIPSTSNGLAVQFGGDIFMAGGSTASGVTDAVYSTTIGPTGAPGPWSKFASLPKARSSHSGAVVGGHVVLVGGTESGMSGYSGTTTVYVTQPF